MCLHCFHCMMQVNNLVGWTRVFGAAHACAFTKYEDISAVKLAFSEGTARGLAMAMVWGFIPQQTVVIIC